MTIEQTPDFVDGYEQGKKDERQAWLEDRRCYRCGVEKEADLVSQCDSCYENE